jgi:hypothetical protein
VDDLLNCRPISVGQFQRIDDPADPDRRRAHLAILAL